MIIRKIAVGNEKEAYVEDRIKLGVNILYSNDNNKGKTVLMQCISYALGYSEMFPNDFNVNDYYVYLEIEINQEIVKILRRRRNIFLIINEKLYTFDSISEYKYFFDKEIFQLPHYIKDDREKICDFSVYYELSFIPQDKRNASNIIHREGNNKNDFLQMIASMGGYQYEDKIDIEQLSKDIKQKESNLNSLKKKIKIAKQDKNIFSDISSTFDQEKYEKIKTQIKDIQNKISIEKRKRTLEQNRITQLENLISELNSLNRKINEGCFVCKYCGSTEIVYQKGDVVFETSNTDVRNNILNSIRRQISLKNEMIDESKVEIDKLTLKNRQLLESIPNDANEYFLYLEEIKNLEENIKKADELSREIRELKNQKRNIKNIDDNKKKEFNSFLDRIIKKMNFFQHQIDPNTKVRYTNIFTTASKMFSGSTETEYYFCRTMALLSIFEHNLPIVIDAFRDKGLASFKENNMIEIFKKIDNQVILTATLKDEEYSGISKYEKIDDINALDFDIIENSKLLNEKYCIEFFELLKLFGIKIDN